MTIHYTGKLEKLDEPTQKKLDVRFERLNKLLGRQSEKELHVILKTERHLRRAELTINIDGQPQAGIHAATDQFAALTGACDKLEKQLLKLNDKRLSGKRRGDKNGAKNPAARAATPAAVAVEVGDGEPTAARIYRMRAERKPMTVDEAMLELDGERSYVAYRDAETSRLSVLIRRKDGHFDLIES